MITHLLNQTLTQYRRREEPGEAGGTITTMVPLGEVEVRIPQPVITPTERIAAMQAGTKITRHLYADPDDDIQRGDELWDTRGEIYRVFAAALPSEDIYLRLDTEVIQSEPTVEES